MSDISKETELPLLASIEIEPGEIAFDPDVTEYTIKLEEGAGRMLVRAKTQDLGASYTVSGTNLSPGANEVVITVTGADGMQNRYCLYVMVGETEQTTETQAANAVIQTEASVSQTGTAEGQTETDIWQSWMTQIQIPQIQIPQDSLHRYLMNGKNAYISVGGCAAAVLALVLWIVFAIKRITLKRAWSRQSEEKKLARQERAKHFEMAQMQQDELLRQIDELNKKGNASEDYDDSDEYYDDNDEYYDDSDDGYDEEDSDDN